MRLHRLVLDNVRGVAHREITLPDRGVIVIEGANEVGKTTMVEALDLLIDEKDSTRKPRALVMRPIGRDVPMRIEAEISSGPYRFTYRKQWFRKASTELTVTAPRAEFLTGVRAHERVLEIFAETADLHLWKASRLMQATGFGQADLSSSAALAGALDAAAGRTDVAGSEGDTLVSAAEAELKRYFTPRTMSDGALLKTARARSVVAADEVAAAEGRVAEVAADVERHARVVEELALAEVELATANAVHDALGAERAEVADLMAAARAAGGELDAARAEHGRAVERVEERDRLATDLTARVERLEELSASVAALRATASPLTEKVAELTLKVDDLAARAARATQAHHVSRRLVAAAHDVAELAALTSKLAASAEAREAQATARAERDAIMVDAQLMTRIDHAVTEADIARAAREAAAATVRVEALAEVTTQVGDETFAWAAGDLTTRPIVEATDITVPGVLRVTVSPGSGAAKLTDRVLRAEQNLGDVLASAGVVDVDEARRLHVLRGEAEEALRESTHRLDVVLAGERYDSLVARAEQLSLAVDQAVSKGELSGPDCDNADLEGLRADALARQSESDELRSQRDDLVAEHEAARTERDTVRIALEAATIELVRVEARLDAETANVTSLRERLHREREATSDGVLTARLQDAARAVQHAEAAAQDAADALRERDAEGLFHRFESAAEALVSLESRVRRLRDERLTVEARLGHEGTRGHDDALQRAVAEAEVAERSLTALTRRADAARLLHETLQRHRAEAKAAYVAPFADAVRRFGAGVYGTEFDVEVSDDLTIVSRTIDGECVPFEALSTGAKEQLAILTRLATASLVEPEAGVPVVIDDALGYSDPERLRTMCAAFNLVTEDAQMLVLTCTPGRYAGIDGATVIGLHATG